MKRGMKWEELKDIKLGLGATGQMLTNIECPKCGSKVYLDKSIILTSYPEKYRYWCPCGWTGYSHIAWRGEEDEAD